MSGRSGGLRSHWAVAAGLRMHARVAANAVGGGAGRTPVVLVPGLVVSSRSMVPLAEHLAADRPVIAPDLPGFGESEKPEDVLGIAELAAALASFLEAIGVRRAVFLSNSFGGHVAADYALRHAERVERLVFTSPTMDPSIRSAPRVLLRWPLELVHERLSYLPLLVRDYWSAGIVRAMRTFRYALEERIEAKLPRVPQPTLVVRGTDDPFVSAAWAERVAELLPAGRLVTIPGAGHAVNYDAPEKLARIVRRFLEPGEAPCDGEEG